MRNVFKKSGDRSGITISETTKGFKIEQQTDGDYYTFYIAYEGIFCPGFDKWEDTINDFGTTHYQVLMRDIKEGYIKPYRTIKA